jgi:alkyldihydroxyacetonephosphate synthase
VNLHRFSEIAPLATDLPELVAHSRDLWPRSTLQLAQGNLPPLPLGVLSPDKPDQVQALLKLASEEGIPLIPYGAGSGVCGAAAGSSSALTLNLKRLDRILEVKPGQVRVQPGVLGQHLEDALEKTGQATRHSPSSIWCSTVGGWAASRSAGQFSSRYGKFEDMVLGMKVITPSGEYWTGEWNRGEEELHPWFLGTEGALGVITELLVRTVPLPEDRVLRGYRFSEVPQAWNAMRQLMQAGLRPMALRLYDPVDTRLAGKDTVEKPNHARRERWKALAERLGVTGKAALQLPLALPRLANALAEGIAAGCVLITGFEGSKEEVSKAAEQGHQLILACGGGDMGTGPGEHWYQTRHHVSYKLSPLFGADAFADTMEVACTWSRLPDLYREVRAAIRNHAIVMAHFSHAYAEGCSIYFSFAGRGSVETYDALWKDALAAAARAGATVAHHHGVGQLKMQAAAQELAAIAPLYHALKARLDPAGIMNPGRLFPTAEGAAFIPDEPGLDSLSRIATLPAWQPPQERDAWLAKRGYRLKHPTSTPLAQSIRQPVPAWDCQVLGCTARIAGKAARLPTVPRSSAGPDLRVWLPSNDYISLSVPVEPL